ncbi:MAG: hypothetical protein RML10_05450 [Geminocystis sp.]|nr:hypothetical protein [Geminocystis sp.]
MKRVILSIILASQLPLISCQSKPILPNSQVAGVKRVVSGQSLDVVVGGSLYRLRLEGIKIPPSLPPPRKKRHSNFYSSC